MAEYQDDFRWGSPITNKETIEEYWGKLMKKAANMEEEEIKFFLHCTTLTGKKRILECGSFVGGRTDLPASAPLASYDRMKGIWLAMSTKDLPSRSPYGSQRVIFRVRDIMTYIGREGIDTGTFDTQRDVDSDDVWDATEPEYTKSKGKGQQKIKERKKKTRQVNRKQKDCYLKHNLRQNPRKIQPTYIYATPCLFFECAHFYGDSQYVRLLLVKRSDPLTEWCREMCMELDIEDNPFFKYLEGRMYTHRKGKKGSVFVEVLIVGDIVIGNLPNRPEWDTVGTMPRAGFDPTLGVPFF